MRSLRSQRGFSAVEALLVVIALGLVGFAGYYVYAANNKAIDNYDAGSNSVSTPVVKNDSAKKDAADAATSQTSTRLTDAAKQANPDTPQSTADQSDADSALSAN